MAWPKLWKHRSALRQANELRQHFSEKRARGEAAWFELYGENWSAEWAHPKMLEVKGTEVLPSRFFFSLSLSLRR